MSEVRNLKIRKNLNRWSRKLLICIGLENIGKHLVGEDKWQNSYPAWRDSQQDVSGDFDPSEVAEQDAEIASADLSHNDPSDSPDEETNDEKNECLDNFLHLLPYWYFVNRAFGNPAVGGLGNPSDEDLPANTPNSILEAFDAQRLNSLLLFETLKQQIQLQSGNSQLFENPFNQVQNLSFLSSDVFEAAKKISGGRLAADGNTAGNNCLPLTLPDLTINTNNHTDHEENDQPLDLTQKNKVFDGGLKSRKQWPLMDSAEVSSSSVKGMKVPDGGGRVPVKVAPRPNQRAGRGYTTQELEAALRDIQSGKLGTRRAAVIYGIPRSTLRNKVYKMGKDRSRPYFRQRGAPSTPGKLKEESAGDGVSGVVGGVDDDDEESSGVHNSQSDAAMSGILGHSLGSDLMANSVKSFIGPMVAAHASAAMGAHQTEGGLQDGASVGQGDESEEEDLSKLNEDGEDISHEKRVLKEWLRTKLSRQGGVQLSSVNAMSTESLLLTSASGGYGSGVGGGAVGGSGGLGDRDADGMMSDSSDNSNMSRQDLRRDVILKIPSLLNKSSLNRVISRKKLKRKPFRDQEDQVDPDYPLRKIANSGSEVACAMGALRDESGWSNSKNDEMGNDSGEEMDVELQYSALMKRNHSPKTHMYERKESMAPMTSSSSAQGSANNISSVNDANGKKSRPKRGKYRNYDRDALLKAVRAVQNGEMSVHRAGSFYGVPHSTLEYKVKERHLLRRPKRKGMTSPKPSHKSSPDSSMSGSEPPSSRHLSASAAGVLESNHLPLTPDLRESLSRYLNIGQGMNLYSSAASSPDPSRSHSTTSTTKRNSTSEGKGGGGGGVGRDYRLENHSVDLARTMSNPFLNLFHLDDLIRHNLDNDSLLDLTKKS